MKGNLNQLLVFILHEQRYGLPLSTVERIARMVEVARLPKAPEIVLGVVNVQGRIVPVVNIRRRFRLPEREIALGDQLVIARTAKRTVALVVDAAVGVVELSGQAVATAETILPGLEYLEGIARLSDGMVFIHDLDRFLSLEEEQALAAALAKT